MAGMRGTLHLLSARDALAIRPLGQPVMNRTLARTPNGKSSRGVGKDAPLRAGRAAVETKPLTLAELRKTLGSQFPGYPTDALAYAFHYTAPLDKAALADEGRRLLTFAAPAVGKQEVLFE